MDGFCLHAKVLYDNQVYNQIESAPEELAQGIIDIGWEGGGGLFTTSVISSYDYRKENPTKARLIYHNFHGWHCFMFVDDGGKINSRFIIVEENFEIFDYVNLVLKHAKEIELI